MYDLIWEVLEIFSGACGDCRMHIELSIAIQSLDVRKTDCDIENRDHVFRRVAQNSVGSKRAHVNI